MRHDLELVRQADPRPPSAIAYVGLAWATLRGRNGYWTGVSVRIALLALFLVPGRVLIVMIWPSSAPILGFGS
jgi:hypothetical protein